MATRKNGTFTAPPPIALCLAMCALIGGAIIVGTNEPRVPAEHGVRPAVPSVEEPSANTVTVTVTAPDPSTSGEAHESLDQIRPSTSRPQITSPVGESASSIVVGPILFRPESDDWLDPSAAATALRPIVEAWEAQPEAYTNVKCEGRTAKVGEAGSAVTLSQSRARQALALLVQLGLHLPGVAVGHGFESPLSGYPDWGQRSVVCTLVAAS